MGESLGVYYYVKKGLKLGDEVVTNVAFVIDAAAQLNNQKSMMNQNVNIKPKNAGTPAIHDFTEYHPIEFKI